MTTIALLYHDMVVGADHRESGFPDPGAAPYKLPASQFLEHLSLIENLEVTPCKLNDPVVVEGSRLVLTFDDGGASAAGIVADALGRRGWPGYFFITGDRIGTSGFVDKHQIRDLYDAGHVVGGHSWSHPPRISAQPWERLLEEWSRCTGLLSDILGTPVSTGSVPGGYFSPLVAEAAWAAGLRTLFTSEPWARPRRSGPGVLVGRFSVTRSTRPKEVVALVGGRRTTRLRHYLAWNLRKMVKIAAYPLYERYRSSRMQQRYGDTGNG